MNLKATLANYIDQRVSDLLAMHNPDGTFGAYPYTNAQYPFYTMAFALKKLPKSRWNNSAQLQAVLIQTLEHFYNLLDNNGETEFYGHAGLSWGKTLAGDWPVFCWQETLRMLESDLPPDMFSRHREKLCTVIAIHFDQTNAAMTASPDPFKTQVHNLFVWRALMLYRAGVLWQNEAWESLGIDILGKAIHAQNPEGWWSEGGPTVGYNLVTATAISFYCEWSGDQDALNAMEKAARFHDAFAYPDGTRIETIDGRMRYDPHVMLYIPPTFSRFPEGQAYLERNFRALSKEKAFEVSDIQGFSFLGFIYEHLTDTPQPDTIRNDTLRLMPTLHSAVMRQGDWCCTLCGFENITHMGGFRLERQNLLSVWHAKTGLILGGGHSNFQPEFSSFNVTDRKGILHYLHAAPQIKVHDNEIELTMTYGGLPVTLSMQIVDEHRVKVCYRIEDFTADVYSRFMVRTNLIVVGKADGSIQHGKQRENLDKQNVLWTEEDFEDGIEHNGWKLRIPKRKESAMVKWPVYPYNSYRMDRKSSRESAKIIVSAQLLPTEPVIEYEIEIL